MASNHRCAGSNCQSMRSGLATDNTICGNVCLPISHAPDDDPIGNTIAQHLWSFFSCLRSSCQSAVCVYFLISLIHWYMFSTLIFPNTKSKTPVKTLAPHNFSCHGRTGRCPHLRSQLHIRSFRLSFCSRPRNPRSAFQFSDFFQL